MSNMYRQQAHAYHELHREHLRRREEDPNAASPNVWGLDHAPRKPGERAEAKVVFSEAAAKSSAAVPNFVSGERGKSFLPSHLVSKDATARHEGEDMQQVLGRMAHRYHTWQKDLEANGKPAVVSIPAWNQAAFKYVFNDAFDTALDVGELQALSALIAGVVINVVVVTYNIFNVPPSNFISTTIAAHIVFFSEFIFVGLAFIIMFATIVHTLFKNKITTGFAVDVVDMARFVGEFSSLQTIRLVSPVVVVGFVLPYITEARTTREYVRGIFVVLAWAIAVVLAGLCVVIKTSQVSFSAQAPLTGWTVQNYLVMVGLMLNLAKVDSSYDAVSVALLESVHRHFIGPGQIVVSKADKSRSLFSKAMKFIGVERDAIFTFFGTVFNYHFGTDNTLTDADLSFSERMRKTLNFMSFVAKLDNRMLERFLEMVESPMYHYQVGRRMFAESHASGDVSGMEMAVWLCDPLGDEAFKMEAKFPDAFGIVFECADG